MADVNRKEGKKGTIGVAPNEGRLAVKKETPMKIPSSIMRLVVFPERGPLRNGYGFLA